MPRRAQRAFTLIELLVVTAIMAIIAAIIVPLVIARLQPSRTAPAASDIAASPPSIGAFAGDRELEPPRVVSSTVAVRLTVAPVLEDARVRARYVASFDGVFTVEAIDEADQMTVFFPFPPGASEVRDASLAFLVDGAFLEPGDARYTQDGVRWRGPARRVVARFTYRAVGRDSFAYELASGGRSGAVRFAVDIEGGRAVVPARSLEPSAVAGDRVEWRFDRMVSSRPIVLEVPAGASPLGRAIALLRWAALAVLIFGAGYWYLGEGHRPGWLDEFRWSHFFLLALDYSLFFAIAAVLIFWTGPWLAAVIAAAIGLPLLVLHVTRIADRRFAFTRALPLAAYTLAVSVLAVFQEERRSLVLLAAAIAALGYVTVTYQRWTSDRRAHRERGAAEDVRRRARLASEQAAVRLTAAVEAGETARRSALRARGDAGAGFELERAALDAALERWARTTDEAAAVAQAPAAELDEVRVVAERVTAELAAAEQALVRAVATARERALRELAAQAHRDAHAGEAARHCAACGAAMTPGGRHCETCGALRSATFDCGACGSRTRIPSQLLRKRWSDVTLYCERCGGTVAG